MIEQILKFSLGGSSRQRLAQELAAYKAAYAVAGEDARDAADALIQSMSNYSSANPTIGRRNRENQARIYQEATRILTGEDRTPPTIAGNGAEYVINAFYKANDLKKSLAAAAPSSSTDYISYHKYDWADGLETLNANDTLKDRVIRLINTLQKNIGAALQAWEDKKIVRGLDKSNKGALEMSLNKLINLKNGLEQGSLTPKLALASILEDAPLFGIKDQNKWDDFFGTLDDPTAYERALALLKQEGWEEMADLSGESKYLQNLAAKKKYKFFRDAQNNLAVYDNNLTKRLTNIFEYNSNSADLGNPTEYGSALIVDEEGNVYMGNVNDLKDDSTFSQMWAFRKKEDVERRKGLYHDIDWKFGTNYSDSAYLQALEKYFKGGFKGTDISSLVKGDDKIFATHPSGTPYVEDPVFGGISLKLDALFYKVDDKGVVTKMSYDQIAPLFNRDGFIEEPERELLGITTNLDDALEGMTTSITEDMDLGGRSYMTALAEAYGLDVLIPMLGGIAVPVGIGVKHREKISSFSGLADWAEKVARKELGDNASKSAIRSKQKLLVLLTVKNALSGKNSHKLLAAFAKKVGPKIAAKWAILGVGALTGWGALIGAGLGLGEAAIRYNTYDNIGEDKEAFAHNLLTAVALGGQGALHTQLRGVHNNALLLDNLRFDEKKDDYIVFLHQLFANNKGLWDKMSEREKRAFIRLKQELNDRIKAQKESGVAYAAKGTVLNGLGEELEDLPWENPEITKAKSAVTSLRKKQKEATKKGYDGKIHRMEASEKAVFKGDAKMTTADTMRLLTMAQDAASIVASFVPGAGTGVAAGLGVTSMLTDLGADFIDPAVSEWQAVKNLGVNAAFAALGMIPGAKMGKVAKNIVKYTPKIIAAASGLGIAMDESTRNTFKKLGDGTTKLNREDWRNISHVLSLIAGGIRGVKSDIAVRKADKAIIAGDNVKLKGVKDANGKDFELQKDTVSKIKKELAKADTEDEVISIQSKYELPEDAIKLPKIKEGKLLGKAKLVEVEKTTDDAKSYKNLRALWNEDYEALKAQELSDFGKAAIWFANKFGGGAYGANLRALLAQRDSNGENPLTRYLEYDGHYNPLIDWRGLREKAGLTKLFSRSTKSDSKEATSLTKSTESVLKALNPHTDTKGATSKPTQDPVVNATPKLGNSDNLGIDSRPMLESSSRSDLPQVVPPKSQRVNDLSVDSGAVVRAKNLADALINNEYVGTKLAHLLKRVELVLRDLKASNDPLAKAYIEFFSRVRFSLLKGLPSPEYSKVGEAGLLEFPFNRLGGQLKYQYLRK